jgi:hypothetical protein
MNPRSSLNAVICLFSHQTIRVYYYELYKRQPCETVGLQSNTHTASVAGCVLSAGLMSQLSVSIDGTQFLQPATINHC